MRLAKLAVAGLIFFTFVKVCWGNFVDTNSGLMGVGQGSMSWGDYDGDGAI